MLSVSISDPALNSLRTVYNSSVTDFHDLSKYIGKVLKHLSAQIADIEAKLKKNNNDFFQAFLDDYRDCKKRFENHTKLDKTMLSSFLRKNQDKFNRLLLDVFIKDCELSIINITNSSKKIVTKEFKFKYPLFLKHKNTYVCLSYIEQKPGKYIIIDASLVSNDLTFI